MTGTPGCGDIALACMAVLVDELHECGVRDVNISPGSRSTPLTLAFARDGRMRIQVHLDERSSAFAALGRAIHDGVPVAVVATSGTAVANWMPAVVEASMAQVPMLLLSADRPGELRGTGANQTIDQAGIFGSYARVFVDAAVPEATAGATRYWRSLGRRTACAAVGPVPGPVHVNLPFREPLIPTGCAADIGAGTGGGSDDAPSAMSVGRPEDLAGATAAICEAIGSTDRGLVVAGGLQGGGEAIIALAEAAGWPLVAEPTSGIRRDAAALSAGTLLLGDAAFRQAHAPTVILQFGSTPTSRPVLDAVAECGRLIVVTPRGRNADPARVAAHTVHAHPGAVADAVLARLTTGAGLGSRREGPWRTAWAAADGVATRAVERYITGLGDEPFEGGIARDLAASIPDGGTLLVGSSMPVRDLDAFMLPRRGLRVVANRGVSGIDGLVSTSIGLAAATPTYALLGDLAVLHDIGALFWAARRPVDLVVVIVNNRGGGIFGLLPPSALPEYEPLFATPHDLGFGPIAGAAGAGHRLVHRMGELPAALREAASAGGVQLVEIPTRRDRNVEQHAAVRDAVSSALAGP